MKFYCLFFMSLFFFTTSNIYAVCSGNIDMGGNTILLSDYGDTDAPVSMSYVDGINADHKMVEQQLYIVGALKSSKDASSLFYSGYHIKNYPDTWLADATVGGSLVSDNDQSNVGGSPSQKMGLSDFIELTDGAHYALNSKIVSGTNNINTAEIFTISANFGIYYGLTNSIGTELKRVLDFDSKSQKDRCDGTVSGNKVFYTQLNEGFYLSLGNSNVTDLVSAKTISSGYSLSYEGDTIYFNSVDTGKSASDFGICYDYKLEDIARGTFHNLALVFMKKDSGTKYRVTAFIDKKKIFSKEVANTAGTLDTISVGATNSDSANRGALYFHTILAGIGVIL